MSTQTTLYPSAPLDNSIAPDSLFLADGISPEFLSLALLEKDETEYALDAMAYQAENTQPGAIPMGSTMQTDNQTNGPRLRNRALRPAPRDARRDSVDMDTNQPYLQSYPSISSFSSFSLPGADHDRDYHFGDRVSPHSDVSSNKSSSPLRWQTGGETEKRAKHLERNRAAASKSRQKKKRETDQLRARFQKASHDKSNLEDEIKDLHSELLSLKDQILMHSRCDDEAIHSYLGHMVKQATKHDSVSSASSDSTVSTEADEQRDRKHARRGSDSISPLDLHGKQKSSNTDMGFGQQPAVPVRLGGTPGLPCGVEKSLHPAYPQAEDIFTMNITYS